MNGLNRVIILGRLGADPEAKATKSDTTVATCRIATDYLRGGEKQTEWHNVVAFGQGADHLVQYGRKGGAVLVEGRLQTRKWQDRNGADRWTTEIVAERVSVLADRNADSAMPPRGRAEPTTDPDDMPF